MKLLCRPGSAYGSAGEKLRSIRGTGWASCLGQLSRTRVLIPNALNFGSTNMCATIPRGQHRCEAFDPKPFGPDAIDAGQIENHISSSCLTNLVWTLLLLAFNNGMWLYGTSSKKVMPVEELLGLSLSFTLHTCTSHSAPHLISDHVSSSHLTPSPFTCHLSKFFSTVFISSEHWSTFSHLLEIRLNSS